MSFYHYTCSHGRAGIGDEGELLSVLAQVGEEPFARLPKWHATLAGIIWLTDLDVPWRDALGLTAMSIQCDRTRHRYRVGAYQPTRYTSVRRELPKVLRDGLENAYGAMPMHWFLAYTPVPVVYDPVAS